ncbi:MAG TPA: ABC transporter permease subunit, partial [Actinomycetota bacterium]|nr:ABC transporter permease subunit [Actinomycetota bacterium]
ATVTAALVAIGLLGVWDDSLDTLSQVIAAALVTVVIGVAIGILTSRSDTLEKVVRPVLDAMQTMPAFVYLIPVIGLFGIGRTPAAIAAVIYALPLVIRLTDSGIRQVPAVTKEAAISSGASPRQLLWKVELPLARPAIMLGVNQGIMMVLAMVIIGALVGGGALGYDVLVGLSQNQFGLGIAAGATIVCLGIVLDRITQAAARAEGRTHTHH